jgi:hypothetical protein
MSRQNIWLSPTDRRWTDIDCLPSLLTSDSQLVDIKNLYQTQLDSRYRCFLSINRIDNKPKYGKRCRLNLDRNDIVSFEMKWSTYFI